MHRRTLFLECLRLAVQAKDWPDSELGGGCLDMARQFFAAVEAIEETQPAQRETLSLKKSLTGKE